MQEISEFENQIQVALRASAPHVPQGLSERVISEVFRKQQRQIWIFGVLALCSGIVTGIAAREFILEVHRAGITQMLTLLFTDSRTVFQDWQDFALSILESVPVLSAAISLLGLVSILISLKKIFTHSASLSKITN